MARLELRSSGCPLAGTMGIMIVNDDVNIIENTVTHCVWGCVLVHEYSEGWLVSNNELAESYAGLSIAGDGMLAEYNEIHHNRRTVSTSHPPPPEVSYGTTISTTTDKPHTMSLETGPRNSRSIPVGPTQTATTTISFTTGVRTAARVSTSTTDRLGTVSTTMRSTAYLRVLPGIPMVSDWCSRMVME